MWEKKDIFVISDLHLGDGGPRDNFTANKRSEFLGFLDHVRTNNGHLMILGDLFEFWQSSLSKVVIYNLELLDKMAKMEAEYVVGNHDADLRAFIGVDMLKHPFFKKMSEPIERQIGGKKLKFLHGHEVDPFNAGESPGWGRMLAIFAGIFEEKNGSPMLSSGKSVEEELETVGEMILRAWNYLAKKLKNRAGSKVPATNPKGELTPAQNPSRIAELLEKYRADRNEKKYDIAIVGHTHQPGQYEDWYYNSGCWVKETNNFIRITKNGEVGVWNWINGEEVENNTHLDPERGPTRVPIEEIPPQGKHARRRTPNQA